MKNNQNHHDSGGVSRRDFLRSASTAGVAATAGAGLLGGCSSSPQQDGGRSTVTPNGSEPDNPFQHGIATGDPLSDRVVFWTRITYDQSLFGNSNSVTLKIYRALDVDNIDNGQAIPIITRNETAIAARDYTIKLDINGLASYSTYYYQFETSLGGHSFKSAIGRTKTLPTSSSADDAKITDARPNGGGDEKHLRLGIVSCSSLAHGFFNAYARLAERPDLDVVMHLGDYIYDYASVDVNAPGGSQNDGATPAPAGTEGDEAEYVYGNVRTYEPKHEISSLEDYRSRHAHYKRDTDLQELHRQNAMINIWDDHELVDNAYRCLAKNHNVNNGHRFDDAGNPQTEGQSADRADTTNTDTVSELWVDRAFNAIQAFREWLPIREPSLSGNSLSINGSSIDISAYLDALPDETSRNLFRAQSPIIFRSFDFGSLATAHMLDTRFIGRDVETQGNGNLGGAAGFSTFTPDDPGANQPLDSAGEELLCSTADNSPAEQARHEDSTPNDAPGTAHTLLGPTQRNWLQSQLQQSKALNKRWNLIGQQIIVTPLFLVNSGLSSTLAYREFLNPDQWDGYIQARSALLDQFETNCIFNDGSDKKNAIVLTGDIHTSWAFDVTRDPGVGDPLNITGGLLPVPLPSLPSTAAYNADTGAGSLAAEFVCMSVTSPGLDLPEQDIPGVGKISAANLLQTQNPHLRQADFTNKGYLLLDVRESYVQAQWWTVGLEAAQASRQDSHDVLFTHRAVNNNAGDIHVPKGGVAAAEYEPERPNAPALAPVSSS
jgi:alkaline phosphatase D